jgi:hypothetical protein
MYVLTLHRRVLRTIVDAVWDQCGVALGRDNVLLVRAVAHQACEDGFGAVAFVAATTQFTGTARVLDWLMYVRNDELDALVQEAYLVSSSHTRFERLDMVADLHNHTGALMPCARCTKNRHLG